MPSMTRPPDNLSKTATSSAAWIGWRMGRRYEVDPKPMVWVRAAMAANNMSGAGMELSPAK